MNLKKMNEWYKAESEYKTKKWERQNQKKLICPSCSEKLDDLEKCQLCGWEKKIEEKEIDEKSRSRRIPKQVKEEVWKRDKGRCVECGSRENLEYGHIIAFSKGGSNTVRNVELLCEKCNTQN